MGILSRLFGAQTTESGTFAIPITTDARIGLVASPDSKRLAYAVHTRGRMRVEVNGRACPRFDAVSGVTLGNSSLAYAAARGGRRFVVFNDREHDSWDDIGESSPTISANSLRTAYTARRGREWNAVIDGSVVGGPYEGFSPGGILFSPDSSRFAYVIKRGDSWLAVVDGREHSSFPTIHQRSLAFSPDSRKIAYVAGVTGRWVGRRFVGEDAVVVDMVPGRTWRHDETSQGHGLSEELNFSPDSNRLAYAGVEDGRTFVVIDDDVQGGYVGLVSGWAGDPLWQTFPGYGHVGTKSRSVVFSPDSGHVAYAANDGLQHILVRDGEVQARHAAILNQPVAFSPDSKHLAYGIDEAGKQCVVLDGQVLHAHDGLPPIEWSFSPDSDMLAYAVVSGRGDRHGLVVGSNHLQLDGGFVIGARLVWGDNTRLHSLVAEGRRVTHLRVALDSSGRPTIAA